jgi:hypothetical protein
MSKPQVKIVNVETGEEILRDANAKEIAQMELDASAEQAEREAAAVKAQTKSALLERLGITEAEAAILLS